MSATGPTPEGLEGETIEDGLPPSPDHQAHVAAMAGVLQSVLAALRDVDFGETPPAAAYTAGGRSRDAAL